MVGVNWGQLSVSTVGDILKLVTQCYMKILETAVAVVFVVGSGLVGLE